MTGYCLVTLRNHVPSVLSSLALRQQDIVIGTLGIQRGL